MNKYDIDYETIELKPSQGRIADNAKDEDTEYTVITDLEVSCQFYYKNYLHYAIAIIPNLRSCTYDKKTQYLKSYTQMDISTITDKAIKEALVKKIEEMIPGIDVSLELRSDKDNLENFLYNYKYTTKEDLIKDEN